MKFKLVFFLSIIAALSTTALWFFFYRIEPAQLDQITLDSKESVTGDSKVEDESSTHNGTKVMPHAVSPEIGPSIEVAAAAAANDPVSKEVVRLLNLDTFEQIVGEASSQKTWTSSQADVVMQANLACILANDQLLRVKLRQNVVSPPIDSYIAHLQAIKTFSQNFCARHSGSRARIGFIKEIASKPQAGLEALQQEFSGLDARSFNRFVAYLNWEANPSFAHSMALNITTDSDHKNFDLLRSNQIQGNLSSAEIAEVYALAAEMKSCSLSLACEHYRPYTMIACMDKTNCRMGESLFDFRKRWASPVVFDSATRLSSSWSQ